MKFASKSQKNTKLSLVVLLQRESSSRLQQTRLKKPPEEGKNLGSPYWHTLKANGFLNKKYHDGAEAQKELLEKKGFKITRKGKKCAVQNYQDFLVP